MDKDLKYLELLSTLHYVLGGLVALVSCIPFVQIVLGAVIAALSSSNTSAGAVAGIFMIVLGLVFSVVGWGTAICIIMVGVKLKRFRSRIFCIGVAAVECLAFPIGTLLGLPTIYLLTRDSVIKRFDRATYTHFAATHR